MKSVTDDPFELSYMVFNPEQYEQILSNKVSEIDLLFNSSFPDFRAIFKTIYKSPPSHCRFRCRFAILCNGGSTPSAMFRIENGTKECPIVQLSYAKWDEGMPSVTVKSFPIAALPIYNIMPILLTELVIVNDSKSTLLRGLQAVSFLCTLSGHIMITLIYHDRDDLLGAAYTDQCRALQTSLHREYTAAHCTQDQEMQINIISRSKNMKLVMGVNYLMECFHLQEAVSLADAEDVVCLPMYGNSCPLPEGYALSSRTVLYKQVEDGFSNPNAIVNISSLAWLSTQLNLILRSEAGTRTVGPRAMDMLELYCGNGNHTAVLSKYLHTATVSGRLLAVESNSSLCTIARENMDLNHITNVEVLHCKSEQVTRILCNRSNQDAAGGGTPVYHSKALGYTYHFHLVLVDPPRCGLDDVTRGAIARYPHVLYISCNYLALHRDLLQVCVDRCLCYDIM